MNSRGTARVQIRWREGDSSGHGTSDGVATSRLAVWNRPGEKAAYIWQQTRAQRGADELAVVLQVDGLGRQWLGLDRKTAVGFREALLDA